METALKITIQNNETSLPKGKRELLVFPSALLAPCSITENADDFEIEFDLTGLTPLEEAKSLSLQEQYRLLCNCAELGQLCAEYTVSLTPDNLYMDMNLLPKLLRRDIGSTSDSSFLAQYKALIGSVLAPKYSFDDYYNGGADLYSKSKRLRGICCEETVALVAEALMKQYMQECKNTKENKTIVGKTRLHLYRIFLPVLAVITVGCAAFAGYMRLDKLPFEDTLIRGNNAYLKNDYLTVQKELSDIAAADLPYESKYILARSYVVSESLNSAQKENILTMLTVQTDAVYFDYWIELGRLNFEGAIDAAQRIGDDQLLLLAYIKYEAFLETDTQTLTGDEKAQKISDLKSKIEKLSKDIEEDREEIKQPDSTEADMPSTNVIADEDNSGGTAEPTEDVTETEKP